MLKQRLVPYINSCSQLLLFFLIAYKTQRHETVLLLSSYSILFALYAWIISTNQKEQFSLWITSAVIFRLVLLFSVPNLSDDFYRFIWDGRLLASGNHPFAHIPAHYIENKIEIPGIEETLYSKLNSKEYFTIYPSAAQFLFWLSVRLSASVYGSLLVLKIFIFLSEIGSIILLRKLMTSFNFSGQRVLIYALNPLVILELTGNAHFEAILIFFLLLTIYCLVNHKLTLAAIFFAISVCVKLVPLIFLPAILPLVGRKNAIRFYSITLGCCVLLFLPLTDTQMLIGFKSSLSYYFSKFEFNASIYYLLRELGYLLVGYNVIQVAGVMLAALATALILIISLRGLPSNFSSSPTNTPPEASTMSARWWTFCQSMTWSLLIYFLFTTTLHPWYISTLLVLAVFTNYRFVILWTLTIFFTYAGYTESGFEENLWVVAVEYIIVLGYFAYELWKRNSHSLAV